MKADNHHFFFQNLAKIKFWKALKLHHSKDWHFSTGGSITAEVSTVEFYKLLSQFDIEKYELLYLQKNP